ITVDYLAFETDGGAPVPPVAEFAGTPTSGSYPLEVSFSDQSTGSPTSWSWTFGDGGTATAQNPTYTYTTTGTYTVSLTVDNALGSDSITKVDYITVTEPGGGDGMHVASLVVTRKVAGPNVNGIGTVKIEDAGGAPVANATVTMLVTGPTGGTYNALTDATGSATVSTAKLKNPSGEWCCEVTGITHATFTYDAGANLVTKACDSGTVFSAGTDRKELAGLSAYPNPFNPATEIRFSLVQGGRVQLDIFDMRGRRVETLVNETRAAGSHAITWRPATLASGVYFARMITSQGVQTQRLLLLK
ncbi:hypothetical protein DRQ32_02740, partial [bacterium]